MKIGENAGIKTKGPKTSEAFHNFQKIKKFERGGRGIGLKGGGGGGLDMKMHNFKGGGGGGRFLYNILPFPN